MARFHMSDLFEVHRIRSGDQRGYQHNGRDDEERENRKYLTKHGNTSIG
jgi:hypothetical protein